MHTSDEQGRERAADEVDTTCPLPHSAQTRNVLLYGINKGLVYFAAPVLYVGSLQAALLNALGHKDFVANLPVSVYLVLTPVAVLIAWLYPRVRHLRPVLAVMYAAVALTGVLVAGVLLADWRVLVMPSVLLHAAVLSVTLNVIAAFEWEVLGRGVAERRRGEAFALAFGFGPILAMVGSSVAQLVLSGRLWKWEIVPLGYPWNYATLFGATAPLMAISAVLALRFELPGETIAVRREPFVRGVLGGFVEFLSFRLMAIAVVAYILIYSGQSVITSVTLFTEEATGRTASSLVGYQQLLRFGGKVLAGLLLAQLLIRTHPKGGLLTTGLLCLAGPLWALCVPGMGFMVSFAILGAGELMGVYFPNYILSLSRPEHMRRNMIYCALITLPVGFAPMLYGAISDMSSLRVSFVASALISLSAIGIAALLLPRFPRPQGSAARNAHDESD